MATSEIGLDEDLFLADHTLGRHVSSTDAGLAALPVMPLTMSMEMLAEAAVALVPGRRIVGMREVRAYRWMSLEAEKLTVKLVATAKPGTDGREVSVQIFEADDAGSAGTRPPIVEGIMMLADTYPDPPPPTAFSLAGERPSKWSPGQLYEDMMFHGPAFRGVTSMDRWGEDGARATLRVLGAERLFSSTATPALATDPVLLDQPGQVVGFWMAEHLQTGATVFPFHLEALHLYGPAPAAGETLECRARIALVGEQQVRSDLDVVDPDGRLRLRLVGWWDRRFDVPKRFLRFLHAPRDARLSEPWPAPVGGLADGGFRAYRLALDGFPPALFTAHGGIWQRALAHLALGRREREIWRGLRTPEPRRLEWLLGRVVAKDALRAFLEERHGLRLAPADVEILPDANGRPVPGGAWTRDVPRAPILSLSHAGGVAVAVVGEGQAGAGVGVDVEHAGRMKEETKDLAFTSAEQALLDAVGDGPERWPLRLWCAKEAVAKALGLGLAGGPRGIVAEQLDAARGTVRLRLSGEMALRLPAVDGRTFVAHTARERDVVVATSLYPGE